MRGHVSKISFIYDLRGSLCLGRNSVKDREEVVANPGPGDAQRLANLVSGLITRSALELLAKLCTCC